MTLGPLMVDVEGLALTPADRARLADPLVGGVILFSRNYADPRQLRDLVAEIRALRFPELLIAVDQEGGRVQRFRAGFYPLPPLRFLGHQYDMDAERGRRLAFQAGWLMAAELVDAGVDFSFAPVVDLDYGISEVIGDRAFHRDPEVVSTLATAYMQGMRRAGMAAVAKHFPGHGHVLADSHLQLPVDQRGLEAMAEDLLPYEKLIAGGIHGIMVAHVRYPQVDGQVASLSPYWMTTVLRGQAGFRGVIFSDDLSMRALGDVGDMPARARGSLEAGADMVLVCNDPAAADQVIDALRGYQDPVGHGRLVTLRRQRMPDVEIPGSLRDSPAWQQAVAALDAAQAPPGLALS